MTKIEWADRTWNPVTGCSKVSEGCRICYAERFAHRLQAMGQPQYADGFAVRTHPDRLQLPSTVKKPTRWFVNSMSDVFHDEVPDDFIDSIIDAMRATPQHTFMVLTTRSDRMHRYFQRASFHRRLFVPKNLWLGVSVEGGGPERVRLLDLETTVCPVRFVSFEPLISDPFPLDVRRLDWVIVGGESGPGARPMKVEWVRRIRNQCVEHCIPFFFKQWGAFGADGAKGPKSRTGRTLDGQTWNQFPVGRRGVSA